MFELGQHALDQWLRIAVKRGARQSEDFSYTTHDNFMREW
jgi:hypothetical protein